MIFCKNAKFFEMTEEYVFQFFLLNKNCFKNILALKIPTYHNNMYEQLFLTLNSIKNNFLKNLTFKKKIFYNKSITATR